MNGILSSPDGAHLAADSGGSKPSFSVESRPISALDIYHSMTNIPGFLKILVILLKSPLWMNYGFLEEGSFELGLRLK